MTDQLTASHIARIIELRDHLIEMGPDRFDMSNWFTKAETTATLDTMNWDELMWHVDRAKDMIVNRDCGTAACIAGHAALLWGPEFTRHTSTVDIARILGMDVGVAPWQAERWFSTSTWPEPWRQQWLDAVAALPALDYNDEDYAESELANVYLKRHIEHHIVLAVMDDLIHGRRRHWYDDDTAAVDIADRQDAQ